MVEVEHIGVRITGNIQPLVTALDAAKTAIRTGVVDLQKAATQMSAAFSNAAVQNINAMTRMQTATIASTAQIAAAHTKAGATVAVAANNAATAVINSETSVAAAQGRMAVSATKAATAQTKAHASAATSATQSAAQQTRANTMLQYAMNAYSNAMDGTTLATNNGANAIGGFNIFAFRLIRSMLQLAGANSATANTFATMATNMASVVPYLPIILGGLVAIVGAVLAIKAIKWGVGLAAEAETARTAFGVFLGSAKAAIRVTEELRELANTTPLSQEEVIGAARQLFAFGETAERVNSTVRMLGDIASAIGQPLTEIADLYGRMRVQGRLFAVDINQLTNRGIPVIHGLAMEFGVADTAIRGMVENGQVHFKHLEAALQKMTEKGGLFNGMMDSLSKTLNGKLSTLKDAFQETGRLLGAVFLPMISAVVSAFITGFETMNKAIKATKEWLTTAFGKALTQLAGTLLAVFGPIATAITEMFTATVKTVGTLLTGLAKTVDEYLTSTTGQVMLVATAFAILTIGVGALVVAAVVGLPIIIGLVYALAVSLWAAVVPAYALLAPFLALAAAIALPLLEIGIVIVATIALLYALYRAIAGEKVEIKIEYDDKNNLKLQSLADILAEDGAQAKALRSAFGKTNDELRAMGAAGQLSGDRVREALDSAKQGTEDYYGATAIAIRYQKEYAVEVAAAAEAQAKADEQRKARMGMYEDVAAMEQEIAWMRAGHTNDEIADLKKVEAYKKKVDRGDGSSDVQHLRAVLVMLRQAAAEQKQMEDDKKQRQDQIQKDHDEWAKQEEKRAEAVTKRIEEQKKEGAELAKSLLSPMEKYRAEHQKFSDMLARRDIEMDTYTKAVRDLGKEFDKEMKLNINVKAVDALVGGTIEAMDYLNGLSTRVSKGVDLGVPAPLAPSANSASGAPVADGMPLLAEPPRPEAPPRIPIRVLDQNPTPAIDPRAEFDRLFPNQPTVLPPNASIPAQNGESVAALGSAGRNMMGEGPTMKEVLETLKMIYKGLKTTSNAGPSIEFLEGVLTT